MGVSMIGMVLAALLTQGVMASDSAYLYRTVLVRAAPGALLELIDRYQKRRAYFDAVGEHPPFMMRHSQGDQWDLLLIFPMESFERYYAPQRVTRRIQAAGDFPTPDAHDRALGPLIAWREDVFVIGPSIETVAAALNGGSYYHVEMFVALPGKRPDLRREREMENTYLRILGRPQNLIFDRVAGAAWDLYTVGVYRDIKHFADSADIPPEREDAAARAAGFDGAERIGTYLRTLIDSHHDTLARAVP